MTKKKSGGRSKPLILVTNDDGVTAPGIRALTEEMQQLGDVVVVAPDSPQSGMGHAITIASPLRLEPVDLFRNVEAYQCSGTPVDCVKLAVDKILPRMPDLCVSGINHGTNSSINVIYSGTISAAMEAAIEGIPAIGFSLVDYSFQADLTLARRVSNLIARQVLRHGLPEHILLNVNIPDVSPAQFKGVRICRQAVARWEEEFAERTDPRGKKYYWLTGRFVNYDPGDDSDEWALKNGYASVVPVQYDLTAHHVIAYLSSNWNLDGLPKKARATQ
ncbi:MAG: 5'/3'-nucleotidase SurE [Chitinophagales bacterium]|nr:5'/3'-nucleotidase SurE [Chitinophagales bacterium]MDW8392742.1 5'/3'-nucleotidase SurE [Chitinophagales bacterium]